MKKVLAMVLVTIMAANLVGCGNSGNNEGSGNTKTEEQLMQEYGIEKHSNGFYYSSSGEDLIVISDKKVLKQIKRVDGDEGVEVATKFGVTFEKFKLYHMLTDKKYVDLTEDQLKKLALICSDKEYTHALMYGLPKELVDSIDDLSYEDFVDAMLDGKF